MILHLNVKIKLVQPILILALQELLVIPKIWLYVLIKLVSTMLVIVFNLRNVKVDMQNIMMEQKKRLNTTDVLMVHVDYQDQIVQDLLLVVKT
jgi:hypothetical protein